MDLNNKNGQPSMEEILASIRRIIAEEPSSANPVIDLNARLRAQSEDHDEKNDFELPSIFRPSAPAQERQPLFGRLTDAIRSASGSSADPAKAADSPQRYRGVIRESGSVLGVSNGNGGLESPDHNGETEPDRYRGALRNGGGSSSLSTALSSLKMTRGEDAEPEVSQPVVDQEASYTPMPEPDIPVQAEPEQPAPSSAPLAASQPAAEPQTPADVQRVMAPFRDMRMSRMGSMGASSATSARSEPASPVVSPSAAVESLLNSGESKQTAEPAFPAPPLPASDNSLSLDDMHRFAAVVDNPVAAEPPPPPAPSTPASADSMPGGIEDTTADLLRPMLRQWLAENMPRMVEKALSIELAESVKSSTRKIGG